MLADFTTSQRRALHSQVGVRLTVDSSIIKDRPVQYRTEGIQRIRQLYYTAPLAGAVNYQQDAYCSNYARYCKTR